MPVTETSPLVRLAEIEVNPEQVDTYLELLKVEIEASIQREPGVHMLYALQVKGRPNQIRMVEVYADAGAYQAHIASDHFVAYKTQTEAMVTSLRLIETDPILLGGAPKED